MAITIGAFQPITLEVEGEKVVHVFYRAKLQGEYVPKLARMAAERGIKSGDHEAAVALGSVMMPDLMTAWNDCIHHLEGYQDEHDKPLPSPLPNEIKSLIPFLHKVEAISKAMGKELGKKAPEGPSAPTSEASSEAAPGIGAQG